MNMKGHEGKGIGFGILDPFNRKYEDLALTEQDVVCGEVVRLRKKF